MLCCKKLLKVFACYLVFVVYVPCVSAMIPQEKSQWCGPACIQHVHWRYTGETLAQSSLVESYAGYPLNIGTSGYEIILILNQLGYHALHASILTHNEILQIMNQNGQIMISTTGEYGGRVPNQHWQVINGFYVDVWGHNHYYLNNPEDASVTVNTMSHLASDYGWLWGQSIVVFPGNKNVFNNVLHMGSPNDCTSILNECIYPYQRDIVLDPQNKYREVPGVLNVFRALNPLFFNATLMQAKQIAINHRNNQWSYVETRLEIDRLAKGLKNVLFRGSLPRYPSQNLQFSFRIEREGVDSAVGFFNEWLESYDGLERMILEYF